MSMVKVKALRSVPTYPSMKAGEVREMGAESARVLVALGDVVEHKEETTKRTRPKREADTCD